MVAYQKPIVFFLVIPTNATTGARIVLDGINGFLLVYDASNRLIASMSGKDGTDSLGNRVLRGIAEYPIASLFSIVQLVDGQIRFVPTATERAGQQASIFTDYNQTTDPSNFVTPLVIEGPTDTPNGNDFIVMQIEGSSLDGSTTSQIEVARSDAVDFPFSITGIFLYGNQGWFDVSFAANWANFGNGFGNVKYRHIPDGFVAFSGMATYTGGPTGAPVQFFTLPANVRPDRSINMPFQDSPGTTTNPATFTFQFGTNGVVSITNFAGTFTAGHLFSLEGLSFSLKGTFNLP